MADSHSICSSCHSLFLQCYDRSGKIFKINTCIFFELLFIGINWQISCRRVFKSHSCNTEGVCGSSRIHYQIFTSYRSFHEFLSSLYDLWRDQQIQKIIMRRSHSDEMRNKKLRHGSNWAHINHPSVKIIKPSVSYLKRCLCCLRS